MTPCVGKHAAGVSFTYGPHRKIARPTAGAWYVPNREPTPTLYTVVFLFV